MFRARAHAWRDLAYRPPGWNAARLARAEADLRRALDLRPRWGEAWADLGWVRAFQGDAAGARAAMQAAVDLDPTHVDVGIAAAELLARQGDVDGAIERLRRLRGVHPGWTDDAPGPSPHVDATSLLDTAWPPRSRRLLPNAL